MSVAETIVSALFQWIEADAEAAAAIRRKLDRDEHALARIERALNTILSDLSEIKRMSDVQNQVAADVAQVKGDITTLTTNFSALAQQIADLKAASDGRVPPDLQAAIDELHTFAQSTSPAPAAPTPAA